MSIRQLPWSLTLVEAFENGVAYCCLAMGHVVQVSAKSLKRSLCIFCA